MLKDHFIRMTMDPLTTHSESVIVRTVQITMEQLIRTFVRNCLSARQKITVGITLSYAVTLIAGST